MGSFDSVDKILDFAIRKEEEAYEFYKSLSEKVRPHMKEVFEGFAKEELGHRNKLIKVKEGKLVLKPSFRKIDDLKISEYLVDIPASPSMSYEKALIVAMKREEASHRLYTILADLTDDDSLRSTFLALAEEEAKHKLRVEKEYDDFLSSDN
ncbi:MAG TPA: rubrerythrin [Thermoplasmatales archaeon]|nr:rubrerythrin [Thermoplasmatales archaeon]